MILNLGDVFTEGQGQKLSAQSLSIVPASDYVPPMSPGQAKDSTLLDLIALHEVLINHLNVLIARVGMANGQGQVRVTIESGNVGIASNQTLATLATLNNSLFSGGISAEGAGRMGYNQPAIALITAGITVTP